MTEFYLEFVQVLCEIKKPIKQLVKNQSWQKLRSEMVGTWKTDSNKNVRKLRNWLGPLNSASDDKLRIVMNYLTGSGFRTGKIKSEEIQKLRTQISLELKRRK